MTTEQAIKEQLRENTGRHLLDSGDYYGRHYDTNKNRDFDEEPYLKLEFDVINGTKFIETRVNLYHFLKNNLEYDEALDNIFKEFAEWNEYREQSYFEDVKDFTGYMESEHGIRTESFSGEEIQFEYTYNMDNELDQDILYTEVTLSGEWESKGLEFDNEAYIILSTHNGCDARGGFSRPRWYKAENDLLIPTPEDVFIRCPVCDFEESKNDMLEGYKFLKIPDILVEDDTEPEFMERLEKESQKLSPGVIYIDSKENGYCPCCAERLFMDMCI